MTIALAEQAVSGSADVDVLAGTGAAIEELQEMGAVQRREGGVSFTHPLLRTTALDLAPPELIVEVAVELLDQLDDLSGSVTGAGTLVRLSAAAQRSGASRHRELVTLAYHEAIDHGSWSAAGDLAEQLVETAADLPERADVDASARDGQVQRARQGRGHGEVDRRSRPLRIVCRRRAGRRGSDGSATVEPSACCWPCAPTSPAAGVGGMLISTLLVAGLIPDESIDRHWRSRAAAILAEALFAAPQPDRRRELVETAQALSEGLDEPLTQNMVHFATGLHRLAVLDLAGATESFTLADDVCSGLTDPWWRGGDLARRGLVALIAGDPMTAISDANAAAEFSAAASNWAEHGMAVAVRSVAATRLGRFADGDGDIGVDDPQCPASGLG